MFSRADEEKPIENIFIDIVCSKVLFKDQICLSVTNQIERLGLAINRAKKLLSGPWIVRQDGYLEKKFVSGLPRKDISVDIAEDDNIGWIELLYKMDVKEIMSYSFSGTIIHFHYNNAVADYIMKDEKGLYLKSQKQAFDFKKEFRGMKIAF